MICAGEGAGVIANIRNASLDRSNICTTLGGKTRGGGRGKRSGERGHAAIIKPSNTNDTADVWFLSSVG